RATGVELDTGRFEQTAQEIRDVFSGSGLQK
ncbi:site-specific DNA-methyltransferase, partial [Escherichia coli]|nr:site-specific DNA-methyltransferase [Escherichia coli]EJF5486970.1 site-specific DNA-methyltransferase [Escherichia coli]EJU0195999.1 site-specific DNA-methyltransferase [Escherichia coli]HAU8818049.1 site-specific DNA-methyltransferase [Escherichia coli]